MHDLQVLQLIFSAENKANFTSISRPKIEFQIPFCPGKQCMYVQVRKRKKCKFEIPRVCLCIVIVFSCSKKLLLRAEPWGSKICTSWEQLPAHPSPTPLILISFKKLPDDGTVEVVEGVPEAFLFLEAEIETDWGGGGGGGCSSSASSLELLMGDTGGEDAPRGDCPPLGTKVSSWT